MSETERPRYWVRGLCTHLLRHPGDAMVVASSAWALRRRAWWRTPPFLPLPDAAYWQFRLLTAYGSSAATPTVHDVVAAARWSRALRHSR